MSTTLFEKSAVTIAAVIGIAALAVVTGVSRVPQSRAATGPIGFFVAEGDRRSGYLASDRELAQWALDAWQRQSAGALTWRSAAERDANVRLYWAPPDDGTFGEMRPLNVNGRPGAALFVRADMEALGPDLAARARQDSLWRDTIVYLTCLHELGHAFGLVHTSDMRDIMYFFGHGGDIVEYFARYRRQLTSRSDIPGTSGLSVGDVQRLRQLHQAP